MSSQAVGSKIDVVEPRGSERVSVSVSRATFSVTSYREQRLLLKRRLAETEIDNVSAAAYSLERRSLSNCLFAETEFDSAVHE